MMVKMHINDLNQKGMSALKRWTGAFGKLTLDDIFFFLFVFFTNVVCSVLKVFAGQGNRIL